MALDRALKVVGGPAALAKELGIKSQAVSQWRMVPDRRVIAVESAVGCEVTRYELRPDLYPPELSDQLPPPEEAA